MTTLKSVDVTNRYMKSLLSMKALVSGYQSLLKQVITMEVVQWSALWNTFKEEFENEKNMLGGSLGDKAAEHLQERIIEHNIVVVSKYYARITVKRLAELLCLTVEEAEKHLSDIVILKALLAKGDSPLGIVCFQTAKDSNGVLNSWAMINFIYREAYQTSLKAGFTVLSSGMLLSVTVSRPENQTIGLVRALGLSEKQILYVTR